MTSDKLAYSVKGAASAIGVSERSIWRRIHAGEIGTFKLGERTLIRADVLASFVDRLSHAA